MNALEEMLTGRMDMRNFLKLLKNDDELKLYIKTLIPDYVKNIKEHPFWEKLSYPYTVLKRMDYDLMQYIEKEFKMNGSIPDNLRIWSLLYRVYKFEHPNLTYTNRYEDECHFYLLAVGDSYEGEEVDHVIEKIINDTVNISPKTKRVKAAKEKLREAFHIEGQKRPRWIQGAEWPCGIDSPMQFVGQKTKGEEVTYTFKDVTTGEIREIVQYY